MEKFLHHVNVTMRQKHNHKQLSLVVDRIESYDAVDAPSDECDKVGLNQYYKHVVSLTAVCLSRFLLCMNQVYFFSRELGTWFSIGHNPRIHEKKRTTNYYSRLIKSEFYSSLKFILFR